MPEKKRKAALLLLDSDLFLTDQRRRVCCKKRKKFKKKINVVVGFSKQGNVKKEKEKEKKWWSVSVRDVVGVLVCFVLCEKEQRELKVRCLGFVAEPKLKRGENRKCSAATHVATWLPVDDGLGWVPPPIALFNMRRLPRFMEDDVLRKGERASGFPG